LIRKSATKINSNQVKGENIRNLTEIMADFMVESNYFELPFRILAFGDGRLFPAFVSVKQNQRTGPVKTLRPQTKLMQTRRLQGARYVLIANRAQEAAN